MTEEHPDTEDVDADDIKSDDDARRRRQIAAQREAKRRQYADGQQPVSSRW